jgi:hypothetical protein
MFDVILRTHSKGSIENAKRIVDDELEQLKLKCIFSLFRSCANAIASGLPITITLFDDHSSSSFIDKLPSLSSQFNLKVDVINLEETGYNNSAFQQYKKASQCEYLTYIVEDDYFHSEDAIAELWNSFHYFTKFIPFGEVGIFPFDCPDRYDIQREPISSCKLFYGNGRYWKTVKHTTITSLYHSHTIRRYFPIFEKLALDYPKVNESNTINLLYNNMVEHDGPITMFSPIPSLAIHMSYDEPISINTSMFNWKEQWAQINDY